MKHHPEQQDDEIYMGNSTPENAEQTSWRTGRLGKLTLNVDGEPCDKFTTKAIKPWFIKVSEVEASIEMERQSNNPGSAEIIKIMQPMIEQRTIFVE